VFLFSAQRWTFDAEHELGKGAAGDTLTVHYAFKELEEP
jgi:hypothetical protein